MNSSKTPMQQHLSGGLKNVNMCCYHGIKTPLVFITRQQQRGVAKFG